MTAEWGDEQLGDGIQWQAFIDSWGFEWMPAIKPLCQITGPSVTVPTFTAINTNCTYHGAIQNKGNEKWSLTITDQTLSRNQGLPPSAPPRLLDLAVWPRYLSMCRLFAIVKM